MQWLLTPLLNFFGGPIVKGLIDAYKLKLEAQNTTEAHAIDLAKTDIEAQIKAREEAVALSGGRLSSIVQTTAAAIVLSFYAKAIVWDKVIGSFVGCSGRTAPGTCATFSTDPLAGDVSTFAAMVISFYFGGKIVSGVVDAITRRFAK